MSRDQVYLRHIIEAIEKIERYTAVGKDVFLTESHWQDAVVRQLEVVGEATKRLSGALREAHPEIPWRRVAGLRDVLIHDYMGVDIDAVWQVTQRDVPDLKRQLTDVMRESR